MCATWEGGVGMLTVGRPGADGIYYISSGPIDADIAGMVPYDDYTGESSVRIEGDLDALSEVTEAPVETLQALLAQCDISNQSWQDACIRKGISINEVVA
jgi:hypothetical protein